MATTTESFPEKFWATNGGLVDLQPLGAVPIDASQLVDRALIAEAFIRFAIAHDEGRLDVVLSVFTDDVIFSSSNGSAEPFAVFEGKDALRERLTPNLPAMYGQRRHCISNICVESLTATEAKVLAFGIVPIAANGLYIKATVFYITEMRKCDDGFWRFNRFLIGMDDYVIEEEAGDTLHRDDR